MGKRNKIEAFLASGSGKRFFNFVYSFGAAIVIIGAMFKIMHFKFSTEILMFGMITEACVFLFSAFDPSMYDDDTEIQPKQDITTNIQPTAIQVKQTSVPEPKKDIQSATKADEAQITQSASPSQGYSNGGQPIIVVGGQSGVIPSQGNINQSVSGIQNPISPIQQQSASSENQTPINVEHFTETAQGYASNMDVLNNNIQALNNVYEMQLKSIENQIDTIKFTNDSLERIKRLYEGAVSDGFAFRDETEKMTKNIEALNKVYARLLQAMTANNPPREDRYRD